MKTKRLIIASILGLLFGFVCYGFACSGGGNISTVLALNIISGRVLIGVAIGISRFPMKHWAFHGLVMGLVFSLPAGFGAMMGGDQTEMSPEMLMLSTIVMGGIYGILIELITTVFFKAKMN